MSAVRSGSYDLLISDLEMPGNEGLRLVRDVAAEVGGLCRSSSPAHRPSRRLPRSTLPVAAYMLKPVHMPDLLDRIGTAIARFRTYRTMRDTETRMEKWRQDLGQITTTGPTPVREAAPSVDSPSRAHAARNVMGSSERSRAARPGAERPAGRRPSLAS